MGRPSTPTSTLLGEAIRSHRGGANLRSAAVASGVHFSTLAKLERGAHNPSIDTTIALARWLGWSAEQVIEAARTPATPPTSEAS